MNLDDRMGSAHKGELDNITRDVSGSTFTPPTTSVARRVAPALAFAGIALFAFFGVRTLLDDNGAVVESIDVSSDADPAPTASIAEAPADDPATTTIEPRPEGVVPVPESEAEGTTTAAPTPPDLDESVEQPATNEDAAAVTTTAPETTEPETAKTQTTAEPETTTAPETTAAATTTLPPITAGVPSVKCPSGARAELELATLSYIGNSTGWNRLDDLVDEQDSEFEFEAWEPGFPDPVVVEVALAGRVSAVDIRVSQDPFTPVSGDIEFHVFDGSEVVDTFNIALDGVDGWRTHTFAADTTLDRFLITRRTDTANIMEVLVCVEP